jgi:hypothetical protein
MPMSQPARVLILVLYVLILFLCSKLALNSWIPPSTDKGLWFYSGLAALLLGNLLVTPFFTRPADAISYAVAAIVGMLAVNIWPLPQYSDFDRFLWLLVTSYLALVLIAGIISIASRGFAGTFSKKLSNSLFQICETLGTPRAVFSAVFFFAIFVFHRSDSDEYLTISLAWILVVGLQPLESLALLLRRFGEIWTSHSPGEVIGEVVGHQIPRIVLIRQDQNAHVAFGEALVVRSDDGRPGVAVTLDHVGFADGLWLRALHLIVSPELRARLDTDSFLRTSSDASAVRADLNNLMLSAPNDLIWTRRAQLVGLVAPDSDLTRLRIEIVRTDLELEQGRLVEVQIGPSPVLYQIVNGITREEIIQQKNTYGYVRGDGKKIGRWDMGTNRFVPVKWVPQPNAPIFLVEYSSSTPNRSAVGYFPGTDYAVSVDIDSLVTHNAAILGILGAGKSFLALELVDRMIDHGVKVICLDLTNQYAQELPQYYSGEEEKKTVEELQAIGTKGKDNCQQNVEEGGSVTGFKKKIREIFEKFLDPKSEEKLKIYNPVQFEIWRQDSKPYQGKASMASLTPTEIARLITEAVLEILQPQGLTDRARCCIVFEEAHSLIPEWNAVASEGDRVATNGTAKAILQGRKYGLGCLVVTQRTANVTKSILNQCNSIFALRVFDATGMEFLKNYVGEDYAGVLSTLEDRHAVVFGRASSCRDPVLVRLNDRDKFLKLFREESQSGTETKIDDPERM